MLKRILCFCLVLSVFFLQSCSDKTTNENEASEKTSATAESGENTPSERVLLDELPELDFNGAEVKILSRGHIRFQDDVTMEELTGEIVNDAVCLRQSLIEDRLNVNIVNVKSSEGGIHGPYEAIKKSVKAGTHEYDIFTASSYTTAPLGVDGIFHNLYDVDYLDLSKPYWMKGYIDNSQIGDKLFTISGDIFLSVPRSSFVVFFNQKLLAAYDLESPYRLVHEGKWTIDKMTEIVKDIYSDLNGDGIKDADDFFGLGTSNFIVVDAYTSAFDLHNILFDANHYPYLNTNIGKFADATSKIYDLNWNYQGVYAHGPEYEDAEMDRICAYFSQGNYIFASNWLRGTETMDLRNMEDDYGILPYPKYNESQKNYYTFLHDQFGAAAIPATLEDTEVAGAVLEALASESRKSVVHAYYDIALKGKYTRDAESAEMIDIIHNGVVLDMSWIYGHSMSGFPQIMRDLVNAGKDEYISTFEKNEVRYNRIIDKIIENVEKLN